MQEATLKLIQVVKEYPLLYDLSHADSKNKSLKDRQWIEVGKRLNIEGKVAKSKWKGLRDCYMKHLRALRTPDQLDPFTKRYLTWTWSEQMSFIKATLDSKQTTSKVSQIDARNDYENEDVSTILVFEDDPLNSNELTVKSKVPVSDHDNDLPIIETSFSMKKQNSKSKKRKIVPKGNFRNPLSESEIDDDKNFRNSVIDFNSNPVIENFRNPLSVPEIDDDIDLMFKSFAKTVKSLSPNRRIFLKAKLAKLIFEEELADSKESPVKCFACSRSVPVSDHITDHGMTNDPGKNSSGGQDGYEYYQLP